MHSSESPPRHRHDAPVGVGAEQRRRRRPRGRARSALRPTTSWSTGIGTRSRCQQARMLAKKAAPLASWMATMPRAPAGRTARSTSPSAVGLACEVVARQRAAARRRQVWPARRRARGAARRSARPARGRFAVRFRGWFRYRRLRHGAPWSSIHPGSEMERELSGKRALVTGASRGIGLAIARRLSADGARVAMNAGHSRERLEAAAAEHRGRAGRASPTSAIRLPSMP